jgi:hypothetical protein
MYQTALIAESNHTAQMQVQLLLNGYLNDVTSFSAFILL